MADFGLNSINPIYINQHQPGLNMPQNTQLAGDRPTGTPPAQSGSNFLGSLLSALNPGSGLASGLLGAGLNMIGAAQQRNFEREQAAQQQAWNEKMLDKENQFSLDMWNKTNEYNTPASQLARMKEAGLNPLYYGLDGSSANGLQSAQALGYDRASSSAFVNPLSAGYGALVQNRTLEKDIQLKNAQIDKIKAETAGIGLDTEWKDKTMDARVEAEGLSNALTKESIEKVKKERDKMDAEIKKIHNEAETEIAKKAALEAQKLLDEAKYQEITELLPYKKLLMEAQTEAEKASAALAYANAAYQRKLIDDGYVDAIISQATAGAREREAQAIAEEIKNAIHTGNYFDNDKFGGKASNAVLSGAYAFNESLGPIFRVLLGAGILKGVSKGIGSTTVNNYGSNRRITLAEAVNDPYAGLKR